MELDHECSTTPSFIILWRQITAQQTNQKQRTTTQMTVIVNITRLSSPFPFLSPKKSLTSPPLSVSFRCKIHNNNATSTSGNSDHESKPERRKRLSEQSSWETKDAEGNDYLYRLGKEADNMNIAVGARAGVIDPLFAGNFLGKDCKLFLLLENCGAFNYMKLLLVFKLYCCIRRAMNNLECF